MQCKFRQFMALIVIVGTTSFVLCFFNRDHAAVHLEQLVSETHKQLENLKANLQNEDVSKRLEVDRKYVDLLGFTDMNMESARRKGDRFNSQYQTPYNKLERFGDDPSASILVVSSAQKSQLSLVEGFVSNIRTNLPKTKLQIWNLDTFTPIDDDTDFSISLKQMCNSSTCSVQRFNFEDYPDHVRDLTFKAYRPIIIQSLLVSPGDCLLWLDIDRQLMSSSKDNILKLLNLSMNNGGSDGIIGWSLGRPTSTLTHPKMFQFFQTNVENYYFHRMIDPSQLLVCKTTSVAVEIMHPWVACALKKECIAPFGAQTSGCRFDKKPLYRYSGCHAYDSAALNVALGIAFPLHQPYIARYPISKASLRYLHNSSTVASS